MKIKLLIPLALSIGLASCHTPSITIYQQGESVGKNKIKVTETRHLNRVVTFYEGKVDSGKKVVIITKLN